MHFTALLVAILPALALADTTTTCTSTVKKVKTVILSHVHPATSTLAHNTTTTTMSSTTATISSTLSMSRNITISSTGRSNSTSYMPTGGMTSTFTPPGTTTGPVVVPTPSQVPDNAAGALDATNVALAGLVGILAVAMM
ncbi:hypothetical protein E4U54_007485 [Claviceps lovelessii]|nr:hypothetical protein E4U54_007485 [Claviceps lovelessii]